MSQQVQCLVATVTGEVQYGCAVSLLTSVYYVWPGMVWVWVWDRWQVCLAVIGKSQSRFDLNCDSVLSGDWDLTAEDSIWVRAMLDSIRFANFRDLVWRWKIWGQNRVMLAAKVSVAGTLLQFFFVRCSRHRRQWYRPGQSFYVYTM